MTTLAIFILVELRLRHLLLSKDNLRHISVIISDALRVALRVAIVMLFVCVMHQPVDLLILFLFFLIVDVRDPPAPATAACFLIQQPLNTDPHLPSLALMFLEGKD
jgi:hypothetical protein